VNLATQIEEEKIRRSHVSQVVDVVWDKASLMLPGREPSRSRPAVWPKTWTSQDNCEHTSSGCNRNWLWWCSGTE